MSVSNKLSLIYDKRQNDFVVKYPKDKTDGNLVLYTLLCDTLRYTVFPETEDSPNYIVENFKDELESRVYDIKTLKFSIELKNKND